MRETVAVAKRYGYAGVEPRIGSGHKHGIEIASPAAQLKEAASAAQDSGIAICCIATSCSFANPETHAENVEQARRAIHLAAQVGSPALRVFGGMIPEGVERSQSASLIVDALGCLAQEAQDAGVTLCMETHDGWCDPEDIAGIMRQVNHPAVAANWDIMHPVLTANVSVEDAFETLRPYIRHVHIHDGRRADGKLVFLPIGQGSIDHRTAVSVLKGTGYDGFLSGEWIGWEPWDVHLPREIAALRGLEQQS